jgi:hypothetical protein
MHSTHTHTDQVLAVESAQLRSQSTVSSNVSGFDLKAFGDFTQAPPRPRRFAFAFASLRQEGMQQCSR